MVTSILHIHLSAQSAGPPATRSLREFIQRHRVQVLNVAGPRAGNEPNVATFVMRTLSEAISTK
jgi:hypothetical protein